MRERRRAKRPGHFLVGVGVSTACGLSADPGTASRDPRDVTCRRCQKTRAYWQAVDRLKDALDRARCGR